MRIEIEIPKEFEQHFAQDKFEDSLQRLGADIHLIAGNYERELIEMLIVAFKEGKETYDKSETIEVIKTLMEEALGEYNMGQYNLDNGIGNKVAETYRQDMNEGKCFAYEEIINMLSTFSPNARQQWLKTRQNKLSELKFRRFETDLWKEQKELLKKAGYFVYDLRDWDEGDGYNIEIHVSVNHIGNWITDIDLTPYMNEGSWIGVDELETAQIQDIPYNEISDLLLKGDELHKAARTLKESKEA